MSRWIVLLGLGLLVAYLGTLLWLGRTSAGGPDRVEIDLRGGIPSTLYLPGDRTPGLTLQSPAPGARPPVVILAHGFSADRAMMSSLARRLARAGYAVLAMDVRGHGQNRNPFSGSGPRLLDPDFETAVDLARASPWVDGTRIVLMGHSMGAGGALQAASRDSAIAGTVLISGGWEYEGPYRPPNALFLYAVGDPEFIKASSSRLVAAFAGGEHPGQATTVGSFSLGTAVREVEVPGNDHLTILWSRVAAEHIVAWMDSIFSIDRAAPPDLSDPRMAPFLLALLLLTMLLIPLGTLVGSFAAPALERATTGAAGGGVALVGALIAAIVVTSGHPPAEFLGLTTGEEMIGTFGVAGLILLTGIAFRRPDELKFLRHGIRGAIGCASFGFLFLYVLMVPLGEFGHRITLTPERLLIGIASTILISPFFLGLELLFRRGMGVRSVLLGLAGKAVILLALIFGLVTGTVSPFIGLLIPILVPYFLLFELLAGAVYARSRNVVVCALLQALWLSWIFVAIFPVRI